MSVLTIPVVVVVRLVWDEINHRRRAAALGARMVPRIKGFWPGNLDVLIHAVDKIRNSYPGKTRSSFPKWS